MFRERAAPASAAQAKPRSDAEAPPRRVVTNTAGAPKRSHAPQALEATAAPHTPGEQAPRDENADENRHAAPVKADVRTGSLFAPRSRREWIEKGWVRVDGLTVTTLGTKVRRTRRSRSCRAHARIRLNRVTILIHKPVGLCLGSARGRLSAGRHAGRTREPLGRRRFRYRVPARPPALARAGRPPRYRLDRACS